MAFITFYQDLLKQELERRSAKNPRYSLRAFAADLRLDPAALSRILTGKQLLTAKTSGLIIKRVSWTPESKRKFLASVAKSRERVTEKALGSVSQSQSLQLAPIELDQKTFASIADMKCFAIAHLTECVPPVTDITAMAKRLSLTRTEVQERIDRLIKAGVLEPHENGWRRTAPYFTSGDQKSSTGALRRYQAEILSSATKSLEKDPIEIRNMTGMVMTIDPERIPEAKKRIQEFMASLCDLLETGKPRQVYQLGVQLFPIDSGDHADDTQ